MSARTSSAWLAASLLAVAALAAGRPAAAAVTSASGTSNAPAVVGTPTVVTVQWRVSVLNASTDQSLAVISSKAIITLEGDTEDITAVHVPRPLKRLLPPPASAPATQTALFRDTLTIPAEIIDAALATNQRIYVVRQFRDQTNSAPVTGQALVPLGGSNTARINVSRIALRFPDGTHDKIMAPNGRSHVLADISYTGTGRFDAVWEIAEPTSTLGEPFFRNVGAVHRNLVGGLQVLTLRSPNLPSAMEGLYLLRLRIVTPGGLGAPLIQYYVNGGLRPRPPVERLMAYAPGDGAVYSTQTSFRWSPLQGAAVYQLEFFARSAASIADRLPELGTLTPDDRARSDPNGEERYPVTGVMVSGVSTQTSLSRLSLSHLAPGNSYEWRICAYDADGQLLGASPLRTLVLPAPEKQR
jgi:hypothetical protein